MVKEEYYKVDPWKVIEEGFDPEKQRLSESIFSIGNGNVGFRGNFEETYSGDSLQGTYLAGIYYPDKTNAYWPKNGYPECCAKVLNAINFIGIKILIDEELLDISKLKIISFKRVLNMEMGTLSRDFTIEMKSGKQVQISTVRFLSMDIIEAGAIQYSIKPLKGDIEVHFSPYLNGRVKNSDSNQDELFWDQFYHEINQGEGYLISRTKKTGFEVANGMFIESFIDNIENEKSPVHSTVMGFIEASYSTELKAGSVLDIYKYITVLTSRDHPKEKLLGNSKKLMKEIVNKGFNDLLEAHKNKWATIWDHSDITIVGDKRAQQAIRFNVFHLNQTYTGGDKRVNVGSKGFTGEKYGGACCWDSEAFCLPFYLCSAPMEVSRNLLLYRYDHLPKAIKNAEKLGFNNGAALYPMATINGEECHNEKEIAFEEIHRNGAIAYAIFNYIRHTGDYDYLIDFGCEVLIALSRFWSQRVTYSEVKKKYVILGVIGPDEYENNVNNNWYTNTLALWVLKYTIVSLDYVKETNKKKYKELILKTKFNQDEELKRWEEIIARMYVPKNEKEGIFEQHEGYMDKEQLTVGDLKEGDRPLNQNWSWDRILRSPFIKQADVLHGIYLFENSYSTETIKRNFDYYESRTVHESPLSPGIHSILASRIGKVDKAYDFYVRSARLDIDDYSHEAHEGLHITSMAGTYLSIVEGLGGKRIKDDRIALYPRIPSNWIEYSFKLLFRGSQLKIDVNKKEVTIKNESDVNAEILLYGKEYTIMKKSVIKAVKE